MPSDRDLPALLRAHHERLRQTPMSLASQVRIQNRLRAGDELRSAKQWTPFALLAGAAVGIVVTLALSGAFHRSRPVASDWAAVAAMMASDAGSCSIEEHSDSAAFSGRCTLQLRTATIRTDANAEMRQHLDDVEVLSGRAWFEVAHLSPGARPMRIHVAGGIIEVVGTKFLVEQHATDGSVELFEGVIRFRAPGSDPVELRAGQKFRWANAPASSAQPASPPRAFLEAPQGASEAPTTAAPHPTSVPAAQERAAGARREKPGERVAQGNRDGGSVSVEDIARQAVRLREEGRYGEAAAALAAIRSANVDARTAEVLSFEEGDVLEHLTDRAAACAHWKQHAARFPNGRYGEFVTTKMRRLDCPKESRPSPGGAAVEREQP